MGGLLWDPAKGLNSPRHHLTNSTFNPNHTITSGAEIQEYAAIVNSIHALSKYHFIKEDLPICTIFHVEKVIHRHQKLAGQKTTKVRNQNMKGNG